MRSHYESHPINILRSADDLHGQSHRKLLTFTLHFATPHLLARDQPKLRVEVEVKDERLRPVLTLLLFI